MSDYWKDRSDESTPGQLTSACNGYVVTVGWVDEKYSVHCNGCAALAASQVERDALKVDVERLTRELYLESGRLAAARGQLERFPAHVVSLCAERDALAGSLERARGDAEQLLSENRGLKAESRELKKAWISDAELRARLELSELMYASAVANHAPCEKREAVQMKASEILGRMARTRPSIDPGRSGEVCVTCGHWADAPGKGCAGCEWRAFLATPPTPIATPGTEPEPRAPEVICKGCGKEVDPDCCGCGDDHRGSYGDGGHPFIPLGCDCFRDKAATHGTPT